MAMTSGFFNSIDGDRQYNARDMSMYFKGLVSDGVYENVGGKLQVTADGDGMTVNVATGRALIDCQWFNNDAIETLTIEPASVSAKRVDAIVLRLDMTDSGRAITLTVKKGTEFTSGREVPPLVWNASIKELYIAQVNVGAGKTSITQVDIVDVRGTHYCPYVTGLIKQVDTAQLFEQYQAACETYFNEMTTAFNAYVTEKQQAFNSWFNSLTETLSVDTSVLKYQYTEADITVQNSLPYSAYNDSRIVKSVTINMPNYESNDILLLYIGGVLLNEGAEYTVSGSGAETRIIFTNGFVIDNINEKLPLTAVVLKSVAGGSVIAIKLDEINGEVI